MTQEGNHERAARMEPSAITVAKLADSHGFTACLERWGWLGHRTLSGKVRAGRKQLERRQKP